MKNFKSIILCGFIALGLLFTNVTSAKAADGHDGMVLVINVNGYQTNQYTNMYTYPNKIHVNEKLSGFFIFDDNGHDISMGYGTDSANGFQNYNSNGWESAKMQSFSDISFSTPGKHLIYANMACKQTGTSKFVSFYIDVV
ncbi:hypothetical protein G9F71_003460 [Clostridium sp. FP2]|uniref:hypothetical protein n=1 Tax=Clostridium sp. FP2 TaxID=2724481 RepID=UPI0013E93167|nr:hypothetical protein [Clostridium sp. FP2]MBZ9621913.1 hypothetical protein [Clostridium sp. FP2]